MTHYTQYTFGDIVEYKNELQPSIIFRITQIKITVDGTRLYTDDRADHFFKEKDLEVIKKRDDR